MSAGAATCFELMLQAPIRGLMFLGLGCAVALNPAISHQISTLIRHTSQISLLGCCIRVPFDVTLQLLRCLAKPEAVWVGSSCSSGPALHV
jgi:hypothetical protein